MRFENSFILKNVLSCASQKLPPVQVAHRQAEILRASSLQIRQGYAEHDSYSYHLGIRSQRTRSRPPYPRGPCMPEKSDRYSPAA